MYHSTTTSTYKSAFTGASFTARDGLAAQVEDVCPYCPQCHLHFREGHAASSKISKGTICYLPAEIEVPGDSVVHGQIRTGAFSHPGVVLHERSCGHLVFVCPVTSFTGTGIRAKSQRINYSEDNFFWEYLALEKHEDKPHNDLALLDTVGMPLRKTSYVHLDDGYWIEKTNLRTYGLSSDKGVSLTPAALSYAQWAYGVAESHRKSKAFTARGSGSWRRTTPVERMPSRCAPVVADAPARVASPSKRRYSASLTKWR